MRRGQAWVLRSEHAPDDLFLVTELDLDLPSGLIGFDILCEAATSLPPSRPSLRCQERTPGGDFVISANGVDLGPLETAVLPLLGSAGLDLEDLCTTLSDI